MVKNLRFIVLHVYRPLRRDNTEEYFVLKIDYQ